MMHTHATAMPTTGKRNSHPQTLRRVETRKDGGPGLAEREPLAWVPVTSVENPSVVVDSGVRFQEIEGFGGAFTEAAAVTLMALPAEKQVEVLRAYFGPEGHRYNLCRTHMNSCDFSLGNYACAEVPGDVDLRHFNIERDRKALIPMIQAAMDLAGPGFKLFASPWSPPAWMKTNGQMNRGGSLLPEYREAWAKHYAHFIEAYGHEGIHLWGLTVQNEPEAVQSWDSCIYTAEEERDFVRDHLGPVLAASGLGGVKILIWDHNRDRLFERAKVVYDDPEAARYVWGTAFHWYVSDRFGNLTAHRAAFPDKKLLFSEGCVEQGPHGGSWDTGERYGRSMLLDLEHGTVGWVDWNLLLDEKGGPNHVGNFCSAPILANPATGEVQYQSSYYYIGHFSRFIKPGAVRVLSASSRDELESIAFLNPDGTLVAIVLNRTDKDLDFWLKWNGMGVRHGSAPHSIQTIVFGNAG